MVTRVASLRLLVGIAAIATLGLIAACGTTEVVREVEVPGETVIVTETVTEIVEVPGETVVVTEIVEVPGETVTVTEIVEVPGETVVVTEIVEVPGETVIVTEIVEIEVPIEAMAAVTYPLPGSQLNVAIKDVGPAVYHRPNSTYPYYPYASWLGIGETLVDVASDGSTLIPKVAASWSLGEDGITFEIQRGIAFHDSKYGTVKATDVEFTYLENAREGSRVPNGGYFNFDFEPMQVIDTHTLFWPWKAGPTVRWPWAAKDDTAGAPVMSKAYYDEVGEEMVNQSPVQTGNYRLIEHVADDTIVLEGVPNHWRLNPGFERVFLFEVPEQATRIAMLKSGQADVIDVAMPLLDQVIDLPGVQLVYGTIANTTGAAVNFGGNWQQRFLLDGTPVDNILHTEFPWVGDPSIDGDMEQARNVRLAFSKGIDRDAINAEILFGQGCIVFVDRISTCNAFHDDAWIHDPETNGYDPDGAKALLEAAGFGGGFEFEYWTPEGISDTAIEIELAMAGMWQEIGLEANIDNSLYSVRRPEIALRAKGGMKDIWVAAWGGNTVSPDAFTDTIPEWSEDYSWNAGWSYDYANELIARLQVTLDAAEAWTGVLHDYGNFSAYTGEMGAFGTLSWFDPWVIGPNVASVNMSMHSTNIPELETMLPALP